jgi:hypothetical protein
VLRALASGLVGVACVALAGCSDHRARTEAVLVTANDRAEPCVDLTDLRVCWDAEKRACPDGICIAPLPVPKESAPSQLGWRCWGSGPRRTCTDRRKGAGAFVRDGELWVQRHPRMPDDGEWSCAEMGGAVVCSGGDEPAGVAFNVADVVWACGARATGAERVCVDFAPDYPDGHARAWRCRYANERGGARICERDRNAHQLGDDCSPASPCLDGVRCVAGRCVPERPAPSCAFDRDCAAGVCRLGTCREIGP